VDPLKNINTTMNLNCDEFEEFKVTLEVAVSFNLREVKVRASRHFKTPLFESGEDKSM